MHSEKDGAFNGELGLNVVFISFIVKFGGIGGFESLRKIAVSQEFGSDQNLEIGVVGSSVPGVGDMTSVHNFPEDVFKIVIRNLLVFSQVVVQDIGADGQVSVVEVVASGPSLGSELLSSEN